MCGIAGIVSRNSENLREEFLSSLYQIISHRGPDHFGFHIDVDRSYAALNARLSIVDRAGGNQPVYSDSGDVGVVYNGEVYNYRELRKELQSDGFQFQTESDTEVVLAAYLKWGTGAFSKLNGMFAFFLWDERSETQYLVRDHIGIKPLYIYQDSERLAFASELKALIQLPEVKLEIDSIGLQDYLCFRYTQAPHTIFSQIRRLDAGTFLQIRRGESLQFRYWEPSYEDPIVSRSPEEYVEELDQILREVIESQLMGEVPIGVLLSGGIDSSIIAHYVASLGANLTTYNIGFSDVNEFTYSREIATSLGLRHVEIEMSLEEFISRFSQVVRAVDEPLADPACFPLFRLCEEIKKEVTVVLSGEGGDEVFGGYPQYARMEAISGNQRERFETFLDFSYYFRDGVDLLAERNLPISYRRNGKYFNELCKLNQLLSYDLKTWMPENLMMKADKVLMSHSLEGRFPFLDLRVLDFANRIPTELKIHKSKTNPDQLTSKYLLKELAKKCQLPDSVISRPKMGFSVPLENMLGRMKEEVCDLLIGGSSSPLQDRLNTKLVSETVEDFFNGNSSNALKVWTLFILHAWFDQNSNLAVSSRGSGAPTLQTGAS